MIRFNCSAMSLIEKMFEKNIEIEFYLDREMVQWVYQSNGMQMPPRERGLPDCVCFSFFRV